MRLVELRLLLLLILVLIGATVIVGADLENDAAMIPMRIRTQTPGANPERQSATSGKQSSSSVRQSRADAEIAARSGPSVIDLVHVLRC